MPDWAEVYEMHVEYVFRFLMYDLGNREDAEDITQEAFVKAFNSWDTFAHRSNIRTWIISIARNLAIDRMRKRQRGHLLQRVLRHQPENSSPPQPEEVVGLTESKRELYEAIRHLKPDYRAVVILKGIQDYSNSEIADILQWSESKVKVTFHRAVKSLGGQLNNHGEDEAYGLV